jgi:BirA family biotin operon repressor/biotin-[acetyl-CoA-carboxylase] ligase
MRQFSSNEKQLLAYLADGKCHSSNTISAKFKWSKETILQQVHSLETQGVVIVKQPQGHYQLDQPFQALDDKLIYQKMSNISQLTVPLMTIHLFSEINSTNCFLKKYPLVGPPLTICCAEKQTHGRGRFNRHWESPFGENIYFSGRWKLNCHLSKLSGLSLVVSLAVVESLKKNDIFADITIKWPNDLLWQDKKLAGILVESVVDQSNCVAVIIGIGINVNIKPSHSLVNRPWCSLQEITGHCFDRNQLIARLILTLDSMLQQFLKSHFKAFQKQWQQLDYLAEKYITITQINRTISGYAKGINAKGELCLRDDLGVIHYLSSGNTSLAGSS